MVVNMIKWRSKSSQQSSKKCLEAKILVRSLSGIQPSNGGGGGEDGGVSRLTVEIKWKGSRANGFRSFRKKSVKREFTKEVNLDQNGLVLWDEEFKHFCGFCGSKDNNKVDGDFLPWEVSFMVYHVSEKRAKKRLPLSAPAVLNLADFASLEDVNEVQINIPLSFPSIGFKYSPSLSITLSLTELRTTQEFSEEVQKSIMFAPLSPCFGVPLPTREDEGSTLRSSLRKVKSLTDFVSSKRKKKSDRGEGSTDSKFSTGSEGSESNYPFDTDSFDDSAEDESEELKEESDVQVSCNYGTLVHANLAGGALDAKTNSEDDDFIYYSNRSPNVDSSPAHNFGTEVSEPVPKSPKFGILAWKKRKLSFRSPKVKGEPLLKKDYGEEGGDDIDFDRRQLSSDESIMPVDSGSGVFVSEFGDDNFAVGSWEKKEVQSRDGKMKLLAQVFFASIDQRSERAAGESACTALVAVIADWIHSNQGEMPIKSEFDNLIREGSLQWRNLCDNDTYRERFPDKHFDLETVLEARIRPLSLIPGRSFIGFFHPEGLDEESFGFLHGAMSFDNIWTEISRVASEMSENSEPLVFIVSWNDHFFLLRVDWDAYYIIDTLGERLYEDCKQAYVLKFDQNTSIERVVTSQTASETETKKTTKEKSWAVEASSPKKSEKSTVMEISSSEKEGSTIMEGSMSDKSEKSNIVEEETVVCKGKECCKEYIKSFLAAIPLRELQVDMKKGLMSSTPLHQRLQIEFDYTIRVPPTPPEDVVQEIFADFPEALATDMTLSAVGMPASVADDVLAAEVSVMNAANAPVPMMALAVS